MMGKNKAIRNPMLGAGIIPCRVSREGAMCSISQWRHLHGRDYWYEVYSQWALTWQRVPHGKSDVNLRQVDITVPWSQKE
jgi:hypothetical protein